MKIPKSIWIICDPNDMVDLKALGIVFKPLAKNGPGIYHDCRGMTVEAFNYLNDGFEHGRLLYGPETI